MSDPHQQQARKVVRGFKASLSEEVPAGSSKAQFDDLAILIQEALARITRQGSSRDGSRVRDGWLSRPRAAQA